MTNIWCKNGNRVAALAPGPKDIFVVTTIEWQRVALQPIADYEKALERAQAFAARSRQPIKVLCMTLGELLAFIGISPAQFVAGIPPTV